MGVIVGGGMSHLARNLHLLARRFPEIARRLQGLEPAETIRFVPARNGVLVPYEAGAEREYPLHSAVDPLREGARALRIAGEAGFLVCYGLGLGYHLLDILREDGPQILLIVDGGERLVSLLGAGDLTPVLEYPRLQLLLDPEPEELKRRLTESYLPGLHGSLGTIVLGGVQQRKKERLAELNSATQAALELIRQDFSVQAHFGRVWTRNSLINLGSFNPGVQESTRRRLESLETTKPVALIGAGASLIEELPRLASERRRFTLIATDTALPPLLEREIEPDLVVSIDAQYYTLLHAEHPCARKIPWLIPLTSPPALSRLLQRPLFFAGGTPLESFVADRSGIPRYDTSGGNVLQTALDWIEKNGFLRVTLFGVDYLNLDGIPYAPASYVYRWFQNRSSRLRPLESSLLQFCLAGRLDTPPEEYDHRYPNRRLDLYRRRIETYLQKTELEIDSRGPTKLCSSCSGKGSAGGGPGPARKRYASLDETPAASLLPRLEVLIRSGRSEAIPLLYPLIAFLKNREPSEGRGGGSATTRARSLFLRFLSRP